jgi:hypothetical protein
MIKWNLLQLLMSFDKVVAKLPPTKESKETGMEIQKV